MEVENDTISIEKYSEDELDCFNFENEFYLKSKPFPEGEPLGYNSIEIKRRKKNFNNNPQKFKSKVPNSFYFNQELLEIRSLYQDSNEITFLSQLGKELYDSPTNLNIYSLNEATRQKFVETLKKLYQNKIIDNVKNVHLNWWTNKEFSDKKALKMGNICNLFPELELIYPTNFMDTIYYFSMHINSPGYLEYVLNLCFRNFNTFDIKCFLIPQKKFQEKINPNHYEKFEKNIENCEVDFFSKKSISNFIENINTNAKQGLDLFCGFQSFKFDCENPFSQEKQLIPYLIGYTCVAANTLSQEQGTNMILKIYNSFLPKTNEILFLLYLIFENLVFCKPFSSNPCSNEKFLICVNFKKQIGRKIVFRYISEENKCLLHISWITKDRNFIGNLIEPLNSRFLLKLISIIQNFIEKKNFYKFFYKFLKQEIQNNLIAWKLPFLEFGNIEISDNEILNENEIDFYKEKKFRNEKNRFEISNEPTVKTTKTFTFNEKNKAIEEYSNRFFKINSILPTLKIKEEKKKKNEEKNNFKKEDLPSKKEKIQQEIQNVFNKNKKKIKKK